MRRAVVLILSLSFLMLFVSCSEKSKVNFDDEKDDNVNYADLDNVTDDEASDENADNSAQHDNITLPDEDTNVTSDNIVETDETALSDEDEVSDIIEYNDEDMISDSDEEMTDSDTVKPKPPACADGMFGLTIRVSYKDGSEDVEGGGVVNRNPTGTETIDDKTTCYAPNTVVALTVVPDASFTFAKWKGKGASKISGEFPNFSITMTETTTVRAEFFVPE